ncbi:MAG: LytTR family transcriptional regulator [Saprospiraceae bacterium]|nr:LytTR family transcriptional regulator [Saprospiraceae bacterium]
MITKTEIVDKNPENSKLNNILHLLKQAAECNMDYEELLSMSGLIQPIAPRVFLLDLDLTQQQSIELLEKLNELKGDLLWFSQTEEQTLDPEKASFSLFSGFRILKQLFSETTFRALQNPAAKPMKEQIAVPVQQGYTFLPTKTIVRCEAAGKYTEIFTEQGKATSSRNIGYFVKALSSCGFFATHKSHLVNLRYVESYSPEGELILKTGTSIPLSRRRKSAFFNQFC